MNTPIIVAPKNDVDWEKGRKNGDTYRDEKMGRNEVMNGGNTPIIVAPKRMGVMRVSTMGERRNGWGEHANHRGAHEG